MRVENTVPIPAPMDEAWELIQDVPRIAPCIPGAELTETVSDDEWKGKVHIKVGPIALQFLGNIVRKELDETSHRMVLRAEGSEAKGRGHAEADIEAQLAPTESGTDLTLAMDVDLQGAVAQYGRGVVADITTELLNQFANRVAGLLEQEQAAATAVADGSAPIAPVSPVAAAPVKPIGGFRLAMKALWGSFKRLFQSPGKRRSD
ncbi:MAG: SRPBCC family protein [Nocardioidaceae bacterium]|nr:MAG: SRPBCC family protein [Nocardioidaceae bacterium]